MSDICDDYHPYAMANGKICCAKGERAIDRMTRVQFEDPEEECQDGEYVPCHATNGAARCRDKDGEKKEIVFNSCIMC